jgi:hypothetical protein
MSNIMPESNTDHVTLSTYHIDALQLDITEGDQRVCWQATPDASVVLRKGIEATKAAELQGLLTATDGMVLVGLGIDGDKGLHIVATEDAAPSSHRDVLGKAIEALTIARNGVERAEFQQRVLDDYATLDPTRQKVLEDYAAELVAEQRAEGQR